MAGDGAHLILYQAAERSQVAGTVTELGEEAHHVPPPGKLHTTEQIKRQIHVATHVQTVILHTEKKQEFFV
ncbi:hypothetical protein PSCICO_17600 [Pseudomonas cichorii]|nr:hypothetical protein PSCICO_17600 [Pseudomonas cichorii]